MAGKPRFRVPTLEEMDKANQQEELMSRRTMVRHDASSKSADSAPDTQDTDSPQAKSSPRKRMMSQKALLSRMPLSRQKAAEQSKVSSTSPNKVGTSSLGKMESTAVNKGSNSTVGDPLVRQRISHFTNSQSTQKGVPATLTAGPSLAPKDITSKWTGNALGDDRRNAQLPVQNPLPPASCNTAGPQKPSVSISVPSEQPGSAGHNAQLSLQHHPPAVSSAVAGPQKPSVSISVPSEQPANGGVSASEGASEQQQDSLRADVLPTLAKLGNTNSLVVNSRQRGNPILKFVRNVPWEFGNIVPDYVMGQSNCALYLSLRYHQLHPEYVHTRLKQLGRSFDLRVLLVQVDIKDPHHLLKDLAKICILADCTLMVAFSAEEAGRYLETYKVYENKAAEAIMERTDSNFSIQLSDCLTRVKSVNKTDCSTLLATFGNLKGIMEASTEDLSLCPGFGPQKAKRLHDVFREPFLVSKKQRADTGDKKQ